MGNKTASSYAGSFVKTKLPLSFFGRVRASLSSKQFLNELQHLERQTKNRSKNLNIPEEIQRLEQQIKDMKKNSNLSFASYPDYVCCLKLKLHVLDKVKKMDLIGKNAKRDDSCFVMFSNFSIQERQFLGVLKSKIQHLKKQINNMDKVIDRSERLQPLELIELKQQIKHMEKRFDLSPALRSAALRVDCLALKLDVLVIAESIDALIEKNAKRDYGFFAGGNVERLESTANPFSSPTAHVA